MRDRSPLVVAIDQGTSSTKAVAVGLDGAVRARATVPVLRSDPRPGWVEQDADAILASAVTALQAVLAEVEDPVLGLGLSTQRESALLWERANGRPLSPMLGWQDRRTAPRARALLDSGHGPRVQAVSGLPLDPMFSALKLEHLLDEVDPDRRRAQRGDIAAGTVDSFLLFHLTGRHRIEAGNASRTQLLDLDSGQWDPGLLELFRIPEAVLPEVVSSDSAAALAPVPGLPPGLVVRAVLGDSHAALYGHGARGPGDVKATYGTGSSVMGLLGAGVDAVPGLARTIAWRIGGRSSFAFEGNVLSTGATLVWLASVLGTDVGTLVALASEVEPLHGVDLVPAFAGLAAPWWSESAEALLTGFTLATDRRVLARAAVDSVVLQVEDVLAAADRGGTRISTVLADGGPSANPFLMQLQADLGRRAIRRSSVPELSALGAASLAAEATGETIRVERTEADFEPRLDLAVAAARRSAWSAAVQRSLLHSPAPIPAPAPDVAVRA